MSLGTSANRFHQIVWRRGAITILLSFRHEASDCPRRYRQMSPTEVPRGLLMCHQARYLIRVSTEAPRTLAEPVTFLVRGRLLPFSIGWCSIVFSWISLNVRRASVFSNSFSTLA